MSRPNDHTKNLKSILISQLHADPQLPRANPTESFWQQPAHAELSNIQSPSLPLVTDYAIIGSGVTGCSVAKNLFDSHLAESSSSDVTITVFEARTLTSGATGRNGGALTSFVPGDFAELVKNFGLEQAVKIARYAERTLERMHELGNSSQTLKEASEVRRVRDVVAFLDLPSFEHGKRSFGMYEEHVPGARGRIEVLTADEANARYNIRRDDLVGAICYDVGAFWPYRLVTEIWAQLRRQNPSRLAIETNTPVTTVDHDPTSNPKFPYVLTTPRGIVRAATVIYATNGHTGHLLPALRGKIFPLKGTMSTQHAPPAFGRHGTELAWSFCHSGKVDDQDSRVVDVGLYYSNQNPKTGDIFIGGEKTRLDELFVSDDTAVNDISRNNISTILPKLFDKGWGATETPEVRKVWSGIMGFTPDHLPFVGRLPRSVTDGRTGDREFIAAAFNGYGMAQCWSAGEAVAKMCLGVDVGDFLPESYLCTEDRLSDWVRMAPEAFLERMVPAAT